MGPTSHVPIDDKKIVASEGLTRGVTNMANE